MAKMSIKLGYVVASGLLLGAFSNAFAFDAQKLEQQGDVYIVSLRDGYLTHAAQAKTTGDDALAKFWLARAAAIEDQTARNEFDITPLHPIAMETNDVFRRDVLMNAYEETAATVDSEAADEEPARVAKMQINYEQWLYNAHKGETDVSFARNWDAWENSLDDLVDGGATPGAPDVVGFNDVGRGS